MAEQIVAKYFISPDGVVNKVTSDHQQFAWDLLGPKATKKFKQKYQAEDAIKQVGWIRCQIYADKGLALEGLREYLNRNGQNILEVLPDPRRVYVSSWPDGKTDYYTGETLDKIGWDTLAAARKRRTQFAALLRQISEVTVDDQLTLGARWERRKRP
jgi:hypothetical protein